MGRASRRRMQSRVDSVRGAVEAVRPRAGEDDLPPVGRRNIKAPIGPVTLLDLERCVAERRELDLRIEATVAKLALLGVNWGQIGRALGVSRQAVRQRYGAAEHARVRDNLRCRLDETSV
jgi:hypothetical protein